MSIKLVVMVLLLVKTVAVMITDETSFIYNNGFQSSNLTMDGVCKVTSNGLLQLTNNTFEATGHAFYPNPIVFNNTSSFSTTFVFAIRSEIPDIGGQGMAFVISPTTKLHGAFALEHMGLFNNTSNGNPKNHVFAVELDILKSSKLGDINNNHVGININGANSTNSTLAGYYVKGFQFRNLSLISGHSMQLWVDYDEGKRQISVTLAPININKPETPLLTLSKDLSHILSNPIYVGFSSSTGSRVASSFYILGWSFQLNGEAQNLIISKLPRLPRLGRKRKSMILPIGLPSILAFLIVLLSLAIFLLMKRRKKFSEVLEDWEQDYGPHRFKYKDLYFATKGFKEKELLGRGGFGRVYKGVLPISKIEVAVKKVSHDSKQGMREFVAEIVSIGRLRHRNLVPLLGYCRQKGELLLVYDFMSNGSLDKYLFNQPKVVLNWTQRFQIIKGVASGLCYLHEEWEQVVVHRDIKASNVLLDSELNARLGDFGLARLYDHQSDPQTTHVVGTIGYLAPEQTRTRRATTRSDVFAFGAFLLEVACGKRPIEQGRGSDSVVLVDYVNDCLSKSSIIEAKDENLGIDYKTEEVELVLKLGLMCSNSEPLGRPSMHQVVQYLNWDVPLPDFCSLSLYSSSGLTFGHDKEFSSSSSIVESLLFGGR